MDIIYADELAAYPGVVAAESDLDGLVDLVNDLVSEEWAAPVTPVPFWVRNIALQVGARALTNPKGLSSWSRSVDDASRTERAASGVQAGIHLTATERARLNGRGRHARYRTVRVTPGWL